MKPVQLTAAGQPANVNIIAPDLLRANQEKNFFSLLEVACGSLGLCIVEVEDVIIEEVALYRVEVDQHILELPQ